jgi:AcrR family transcriptional regulator
MSAPTRRERLRAETLREIKGAALDQLREVGAAQLSLRAVASALGMSPAGLYRYYDGRDALLTVLIADAFTALAEAVEQARDADPQAGLPDRMLAAMRAYRGWAVAHPQEFGLAYGTPVPGFAAPVDGPTSIASRRVGGAFVPLFVEAWHQGGLRRPAGHTRDRSAPPAPPSGHAHPGPSGPAPARPAPDLPTPSLHPDLPPEAAPVVLGAWARLHGLVVLEVFGHLNWLVPDAGPLAEQQFRLLVAELGLTG